MGLLPLPVRLGLETGGEEMPLLCWAEEHKVPPLQGSVAVKVVSCQQQNPLR